MSALQSVNDSLKNFFTFLENDYVKGVLLTLIILYGSNLVPKLNHCTMDILNNKIVTFLMIFIIIYIIKPNPLMALILSVVILIIIMLTSDNNEKNEDEPMVEVEHVPQMNLPKFNLPQEEKRIYTKKIDEILRINELKKLEEEIIRVDKNKAGAESEDKIGMVIDEVQRIEYKTGKKPNNTEIKKICKSVNEDCMFSEHALSELKEINHADSKKELDGVYSSLNGTDGFAALY